MTPPSPPSDASPPTGTAAAPVLITCSRQSVPEAPALPTVAWQDLSASGGARLRSSQVAVVVPPRQDLDEWEPNLGSGVPQIIEAVEDGLTLVVLVPSWGTARAEFGTDNDVRQWVRELLLRVSGFPARDLSWAAARSALRRTEADPILFPGRRSAEALGLRSVDELDPLLEFVLPSAADEILHLPSVLHWRQEPHVGLAPSLWWRRGGGWIEPVLFRPDSLGVALDLAARIGARSRLEEWDHEAALTLPPHQFPNRRQLRQRDARRAQEQTDPAGEPERGVTFDTAAEVPDDRVFSIEFSNGHTQQGVLPAQLRETLLGVDLVVDLAGALELGPGIQVARREGDGFIVATVAGVRSGTRERAPARMANRTAFLLGAWIQSRGRAFNYEKIRTTLHRRALELRRGNTSFPNEGIDESYARQFKSEIGRCMTPPPLVSGTAHDGSREFSFRPDLLAALIRSGTA